MSWLSYIYPQTVIRTSTKYNQDIRVNEEYGRYKLLVNGSRQSGAYIEMLWKKAFDNFNISSRLPIDKILVLGVAGGTVIHLLHRMFPKASIQGVDIDQEMIDIGLTYFGLKNIDNARIECADAKNFIVKAAKHKKLYDLIIVDLFSGRIIPDFVGEKSFLFHLRRLAAHRGMIIINYLQELEYFELSKELDHELLNIFGNNNSFSIERNRFFFVVHKE